MGIYYWWRDFWHDVHVEHFHYAPIGVVIFVIGVAVIFYLAKRDRATDSQESMPVGLLVFLTFLISISWPWIAMAAGLAAPPILIIAGFLWLVTQAISRLASKTPSD